MDLFSLWLCYKKPSPYPQQASQTDLIHSTTNLPNCPVKWLNYMGKCEREIPLQSRVQVIKWYCRT